MRAWIVALALLGAACSSGDTNSGEDCGPNGECPSGFECNPVDNRCVTIGSLGRVALSLSVAGPGTVTASGAPSPCGTASCSFTFARNAMVTLTATATSGARFKEWAGACSGTTPTITVTMDAAKSCTATFVERVMVSASVTGATGSVAASSSDTAASCSGASCTIDKGGSVTLTAPSLAGSRFTRWSGTGCSG